MQRCGLPKILGTYLGDLGDLATTPPLPSRLLRLARTQTFVALKVSVAEVHGKSRELKVLRTLAELNCREPGSQHVLQLLDRFYIEGPNGKHECLVFEMLGPSVTDVLERRVDERLPGTVAITSVQQALAGLVYLHKHNIGHGGKYPLRRSLYLLIFGSRC